MGVRSALMPIEVEAIDHWACVDMSQAKSLVGDMEVKRVLTVHRGGPPDLDVSIEATGSVMSSG